MNPTRTTPTLPVITPSRQTRVDNSNLSRGTAATVFLTPGSPRF